MCSSRSGYDNITITVHTDRWHIVWITFSSHLQLSLFLSSNTHTHSFLQLQTCHKGNVDRATQAIVVFVWYCILLLCVVHAVLAAVALLRYICWIIVIPQYNHSYQTAKVVICDAFAFGVIFSWFLWIGLEIYWHSFPCWLSCMDNPMAWFVFMIILHDISFHCLSHCFGRL